MQTSRSLTRQGAGLQCQHRNSTSRAWCGQLLCPPLDGLLGGNVTIALVWMIATTAKLAFQPMRLASELCTMFQASQLRMLHVSTKQPARWRTLGRTQHNQLGRSTALSVLSTKFRLCMSCPPKRPPWRTTVKYRFCSGDGFVRRADLVLLRSWRRT